MQLLRAIVFALLAALLAAVAACTPQLAAAQGCGAQNPGCVVPNRPAADNGFSAANTAFVQAALSGYVGSSALATLGTVTTGTWHATPIAGLYGGTGLATAAVGDLLYASATTPTWSRLPAVATGSLLGSAGTNTAPAYCAACTLSTSLTTPLVIGGTATSAPLTLESTSGAGATDYIAFLTGSQSERMRILTGGNVGIGTAVPGATLSVSQNVTATTPVAGAVLELVGKDNTATNLAFTGYGVAGTPNVLVRRALGTAGNPSALGSGGQMFGLFAQGYGATGFAAGFPGITIEADQIFTDANQGVRISLYTVPDNTTTQVLALRANASGGIGIGASAPDPGINSLIMAGHVQLGSTTALTLAAGELGFAKIAASGSAPGASGGKVELVCGTGAGSAKIIAYAGTSTTPVTVLDNIGSGVTGC